jgi:hypothetical protein
MRRWLRWVLVVTCMMMLSSAVTPAAAEKASVAAEPQQVWYGWQTLIVDGSVLLLLPLALGAETQNAGSNAALALAVGGYALGAPIVHLAHGNYGRAAGSFALRVTLPLLAVAQFASAPSSDNSDGNENPYRELRIAAAVVLVGSNALAAVIVDAAVLSYETREPKPRRATLQLTPRFSPQDRSAGLVMSGTF